MWKCSECGIEIEGNFCGKCGGSRMENETLPSTAEGDSSEQSMAESAPVEPPMPDNVYQQPTLEESGRKGCIIAAILIVAIIALLSTVVYFAVSLIFNNVRDNQEDGRLETEVNLEVILDEEETRGIQIEIMEWESPFNFDVWDSSEIFQIELNGIVLDVPVPPNSVVDEETNDSAAFFFDDSWVDWLEIEVILRNMKEGDFEEYFAEESAFNIEWHGYWAEILDKQEVVDGNRGLMVTHWETDEGEGFTFTKISQYREAVLLTEIRVDSIEGREELFEAYGFMDAFGEIIESIFEDMLSEETDTAWERVGFDSPEEAVIAFLEGLRDSDSDRMAEALGNSIHAEVMIDDFISVFNFLIEEFHIPVAPYEFQSLEIIGFLPPEALSELYLEEEKQTHMSNQAERMGLDQIVCRVVIFELGGEKQMLMLSVDDVDGKWRIPGFGGHIAALLNISASLRGIIPSEFLDEFIGEIDLEAQIIPVD